MAPNDVITTLHPENKKGIAIPRNLYDDIVMFIVNRLEHAEEVSLSDLLQSAVQHFQHITNISWWVYHVKLDWEARGHIRLAASIQNHHVKIIKLTGHGMRALRSLKLKVEG